MAITPVLVTVTVTTAGTQVQVTTDTDIKPKSVYFEADSANTGVIYIGNSTVSSTSYFARLTIPSTSSSPNWSITGADGGRVGSTGIQLSDIWVDSSVSGEKVHVTYIYETGG